MDNSEYIKYLQKQYLDCKLCANPLQKPKLLPCQHAFCCDCIGKYIDANIKDGYYKCPTCSSSHSQPENGPHSLPTAVVIKSMLETMNLMQKKTVQCTRCDQDKVATSACTTCGDLLCHDCELTHKNDEETASHMLLILEELSHIGKLESFQKVRYNACWTHEGEKCMFYCSNDGQQVCEKCKSGSKHEGHNVVKIEAELQQLKSATGSLKLDMRNHAKALHRQKQALDKAFNKITQEEKQFLDKIAQNFKYITEKLKSYYNFIVNEIKDGSAKQQEFLQSRIAKIQTVTEHQEETVFRTLLHDTLPVPIALWVAQELGTTEVDTSYQDFMSEDQIRKACPGIKAINSTFDFKNVEDFLRPVTSYMIGKRDDSCEIM